jgi:hypothetical protein
MELAAFASFALLVVAWLIAPTKTAVARLETAEPVAAAAHAEAA